jgi:hypothetical protein
MCEFTALLLLSALVLLFSLLLLSALVLLFS